MTHEYLKKEAGALIFSLATSAYKKGDRYRNLI